MTATAEATQPMNDKQRRMLFALLSQAGLVLADHQLEWINGALGTEYTSRKEITGDDASSLLDTLSDEGTRAEIAGREKMRTPLDPDDAPPVQEAIRRVMVDAAIIGVGKTGYNKDQDYNFRGIDDVMNTLSPILAKHGVVILPTVGKMRFDHRTTKSGSTMTHAIITVHYKICGPRGDSVRARMVGTGADISDKYTNKALSAAYKYLLGEVFAIRNIGMQDGDFETPSIEPRGEETYRQRREPTNPNAAAPPMQEGQPRPNADLLEKITAYARRAGVSLEQFTAQFRANHNNATLDQMSSAPREILNAYVRQIEAYFAQEEEAPAQPEATQS